MSTNAEQIDSQMWLRAAIEALIENDGPMTLSGLARAVGRQLEIVIDTNERAALEQILVRDGATLVRQDDEDLWDTTIAGRTFFEQQSTDREEQISENAAPPGLPDPDESTISSPFNPALIRVDSEQMPIYHALNLIAKKRIKLDPEFQRNFIWEKTRQSRLIESILLRIPLPAIYLDAAGDGTYEVIDGRQRLTTLDEFCNKQTLRLTGLEHLKDLEGSIFDKLPLPMQTTLTERTKLTVFTILPETPPQVKFMIFSRVNTGGLILTAQEIRHALYQGQATTVLDDLATSGSFLDATGHSISQRRMDDRECVLRFLAFHLNSFEEFGTRLTPEEPANLDGLLNRTMGQLNAQTAAELSQTQAVFLSSMIKASKVFGRYAFRKIFARNDKRQPVNKPLFEVWGVLLKKYELSDLEQRREVILDAFIDVMTGDNDFVTAISYGTGSPGSVKYRFRRIARLLQEVME